MIGGRPLAADALAGFCNIGLFGLVPSLNVVPHLRPMPSLLGFPVIASFVTLLPVLNLVAIVLKRIRRPAGQSYLRTILMLNICVAAVALGFLLVRSLYEAPTGVVEPWVALGGALVLLVPPTATAIALRSSAPTSLE